MKIGLALESTFDCDAGVQQYFKGLGRYLLSKGHDVKFIVPYSSEKGEFKGRIYSVGIVFNPPINTTSIPLGLYSSGTQLRRILDREKFDVIHVGTPFSPFSLGTVVKHARCPVVSTYMILSKNVHQKNLHRFLSSILVKSGRYIDAHIAPNEMTATEAEFVVPGSYRIIPHGMDISTLSKKVRPIAKFSQKTHVLLYLGRLEHRKGVHLLVSAMPSVLKKVPDAHLVIAGDGPMREELEKMTQELGIKKHVSFEGYIDEKDKPSYYAAASVCVFPAIYGECFGMVLIESLASGKIPIAFANQGYASVLHRIPDALVPVGDTQALSERIVHFLLDEKHRRQVEKTCRDEANRYSWETVGNSILSVYRSLLKRT
ncbi:MAG: glycosyltransferase family 4 protein [Candidatus Dojkabacteria bacterium]|nr:glycosyltransferase family 4 protein [Candidatus Dojkabacteria bacterium]